MKYKIIYNVVTLVLFYSAISFSLGQTVKSNHHEFGQPFLKYYSPKEYKANPANWSIYQDNRGIIYAGNETGLLEFDGVSWRRIDIPYNVSIRSITKDNNGKIYVCASSDFGYLRPDSSGQMKFVSLLGFLKPKDRDFGEMWDVAASSKAVYFKTKDKIFRWNGKNIKIWDSVYAFRLYKINDKIYSRNNGKGLMVIDGDSLKIMPDGQYFSHIGVFNMLPYKTESSAKSKSILVTTNYNGLYLFDGEKFSPFKTEADSLLKKDQIYNACITANGNFAFATQRGGVIIIDHKGHLIRKIDEDSGLPTNVIYDIYPGRQGGLWLATNNGIVHCEYPSPLSILPRKGLIKNPSFSLLRFDGKLYAANEMGVIYWNADNNSFEPVKGINKPAFQLLNYNGMLLAATNWGVGLIKNNKLEKTLTDNSTNFLLPSKFYKGRIYVAHRDGLSILQLKGNGDFSVYKTDLDEELVTLAEDKDSSLWIGSLDGGIIHVNSNLSNLLPGVKNKLSFNRYRKEKLPAYQPGLLDIRDKVLFTTPHGIFHFDKVSDSFVPDSTLSSVFRDSANSILLIKKSTNNDLWILGRINGIDELGKAVLRKNNTYKWIPLPIFRRLDLNNITALYVENDSISNNEKVWLSSDEGLVYYKPSVKKDINTKFLSLIRKVSVKGDSIIFGGTKKTGSPANKLKLPFSRNNVSFNVAAVTYDKPEAARYQYYLEGNDNGWSLWTSEPRKEYTNLSSGSYIFRVRSKNVYGIIGEEDTFFFSVLPAWYQSWWAYILYALLIISGVFIFDRIMRRRIIMREHQKAKLREAELVKKQAEELETVDRLVKVINNAEDINTLFNSLLIQTVGFIPKAEKAAVFLLDHKDNKFRIAFTLGYNVDDLKSITFEPVELEKRYTENSTEIEKGIYIINNTASLYGDEKLVEFTKAASMLVMAVEWDNKLEAYVVFDSFEDKNSFEPSTARILNRFREHAVSAISKAQSIKMLQEKNNEIIKAQEQLITQQKLASLGALTAGIAHEIKNPLNFVNNFAELSEEMFDDLVEVVEREKNNINKKNFLEIKDLISKIKMNLEKIGYHGRRADSIVRGMLLHSRGSSGEKTASNINELLDQYVQLAYHGLRAQDKTFNISIEKNYDQSIPLIKTVQQDMSRVFLNVINNACYAANCKKRKNGAGDYVPTLKVSTKNLDDKIEIRIKDNGCGIPNEIKDKLFHPFFTTKPAGDGTGLGLSLSYDIVVKEHSGEIKFLSEFGKYTEFIILLPKG